MSKQRKSQPAKSGFDIDLALSVIYEQQWKVIRHEILDGARVLVTARSVGDESIELALIFPLSPAIPKIGEVGSLAITWKKPKSQTEAQP